ncbi:MAG: EAL domain-containing protein [Acidaminococcaceae bacterium]
MMMKKETEKTTSKNIVPDQGLSLKGLVGSLVKSLQQVQTQTLSIKPCERELSSLFQELLAVLPDAVIQKQLTTSGKNFAYYDTLTGLYNKDGIFNAVRTMLAAHPKEQFVFIRYDINRFNLINSFFGMEEGDKVIRYNAQLLQASLKNYPLSACGRIIADVFCVCVALGDKKVEEVLHEIVLHRDNLRNYSEAYDIVPNYGIYLIEDNTMEMNSIYDNATLAAKSCKGSYVSSYAFYTPSMLTTIVHDQEITNEMTGALARQEFIIYLQPQYNMRDRTIAGAEALVRWLHPTKGIISPGEFIPVFERNGFIAKLDYYVWEQVCKCLRRWQDEGKRVLPISVNVSRVNLANPQFVHNLIGLVEKYKIAPSLLDLELTESAYADNPQVMIDLMEILHAYGFKIYMDDFGSGYSSLNVLKDIAIDVIKIDMKFFQSGSQMGRAENIISAVVRMANWLAIPVVAEGVETKEQADMLWSIGCDYVQGFYFARPMAVADYEVLVSLEDQSEQKHGSVQNVAINIDQLWACDAQVNLLFNSMISGIAIYELCGDHLELIRANESYFEIIGKEEGSFKDLTNLMTKLVPGQEKKVMRVFNEALTTGKACKCELERYNSQGKLIWLQVKIKHLVAMAERHLFYGAVTDITVQKKTEKRLVEEIAKLRKVECEFNENKNYRQIWEAAGEAAVICNVTQNRLLEGKSKHPLLQACYDKSRTLDEYFTSLGEQLSSGRQQETFNNIFQQSKLQEAFKRGDTEQSLVHVLQVNVEQMLTVRTTIMLMSNTENSDVLGFMHCVKIAN